MPTFVLSLSAAWRSDHIGSRVASLAGAGEIVVSSTVKELVIGSGMQFADRGEHELKGVPGTWRLYALGHERTPRAQLDGAAGYMRRSDRLAGLLRAPDAAGDAPRRAPRWP